MKEERRQILYEKRRASDGRTRGEADGIAVETGGGRRGRRGRNGMGTETGREGAAGRSRRKTREIERGGSNFLTRRLVAA